MVNYFRNILSSEYDRDPGFVRLVRIVLGISTLSIVAIAIVLALTVNDPEDWITVAVVGGMTILIAATLFFAYRNILWPGKVLFPLVILVAVTYLAIRANGLHDSSIVGFTIVIIVTSLIAGQKAIPLATFLTVLGVWVVTYGDMSGINQSTLAYRTGWDDVTIVTLVQVLAAASLNGLMTRLNSALATSRANEQAQIKSNQELRELQTVLEQRVQERTIKMERRNLDLAIAAEVGRAVSQVRTLDVMLTEAVELIREKFDLYYVQVYLVDSNQNTLRLQTGTGDAGRELLERAHSLPLDENSINGRAAATKRPVVIADTTGSPSFRPNPLLPNTRSEIAVPLLVGDTLIGVLDVQSEQAGALNEEALLAFEPMSGQMAVAIQNARLVAEAQQTRADVEEQVRQTQSALAQVEEQSLQTQAALEQAQAQYRLTQKLSDAGLLFTRASNLQDVVKTAVETLEIAEINRAVLEIFNYNLENEVIGVDVLANWWNGTGYEPTPVGARYTIESLPLIGLFITPTPIFIEEAFYDARIDDVSMQIVKRLNIHALAMLPLFTADRQLGVLLLESEQPYKFKQDETRLFSAMAPQIATVLENRRQFERARQQAERESALNLISQKIQSATTVEAVLQIAAREIGHALGTPMTVAQLSMKDDEIIATTGAGDKPYAP